MSKIRGFFSVTENDYLMLILINPFCYIQPIKIGAKFMSDIFMFVLLGDIKQLIMEWVCSFYEKLYIAGLKAP